MPQKHIGKLIEEFEYFLNISLKNKFYSINNYRYVFLSDFRLIYLTGFLTAILIPCHSVTAGTFIINNEHNANTGNIVIDGQVIGGGSNDIVKGSGNSAKESRSISGYRKIKAKGGLDIIYQQADSYSLSITADDNIIPIITTNVSGDSLIISTKKSYSTDLPVSLQISSPALEAVYLDGSGSVELKDIHAKELSIDLNGTGDISMDGKVSDLSVKIGGAGNIDSKELEAENVEAQIMGSGNLKVTVHDKLKANIVGTGELTYYGNPKVIDKNIIGVGDISAGD